MLLDWEIEITFTLKVILYVQNIPCNDENLF